jgi:hypothetical protein
VTNKLENTTPSVDMDKEQTTLVTDIRTKLKNGEVSEAKLSTDEKVLARVTDGIYRQPSSAIRELISNAYDADAETVYIDTDAPRFNHMTIRDDGNGMSIEVLANLIYHIGGSAKRSANPRNTSLGITNEDDPTLSPQKKRKLIGKIGIGLFSVAQLTRTFTIVTKQAGTDYYLIADIELNNYSEQIISSKEKRGESFDTGVVKIKTEKTSNTEAHGTDIILKNIKKSAKDQLKSVDLWLQESVDDESEVIQRTFHIGCTDINDHEKLEIEPQLPWAKQDTPKEKFTKFYNSMIERTNTTVTPKLEEDLDNYLNMLWVLGLSVPVDYIEKHPFLLTNEEYPHVFKLSNKKGGKSEKILLVNNTTIKNLFTLKTETNSTGFQVFIDDVELFRPIKFTQLPSTQAIVKEPILFIGSAKPDLSRYEPNITGGELSFDAYILWCPKVIPKEHNGVILRINNASGILFDTTFMKYQVSEYTIRGQLTAEIFINEGLDSALNIDRESFNISHPHYQIIMRWLHDSLRQVISKYKEIKREERHKNSETITNFRSQSLSDLVIDAAKKQGKEIDEIRPVEFISNNESKIDSYVIDQNEFSRWIGDERPNPRQEVLKEKVSAIIQVLDSFDLLDGLSADDRKTIFEMISKVLNVD